MTIKIYLKIVGDNPNIIKLYKKMFNQIKKMKYKNWKNKILNKNNLKNCMIKFMNINKIYLNGIKESNVLFNNFLQS